MSTLNDDYGAEFVVCRPQGGQGDLGSAWLAQSGRADRSLDPEGSTDRFDTRALKRRF